jgi:hypothetical protein
MARKERKEGRSVNKGGQKKEEGKERRLHSLLKLLEKSTGDLGSNLDFEET